jgi:hypothetical protein
MYDDTLLLVLQNDDTLVDGTDDDRLVLVVTLVLEHIRSEVDDELMLDTIEILYVIDLL